MCRVRDYLAELMAVTELNKWEMSFPLESTENLSNVFSHGRKKTRRHAGFDCGASRMKQAFHCLHSFHLTSNVVLLQKTVRKCFPVFKGKKSWYKLWFSFLLVGLPFCPYVANPEEPCRHGNIPGCLALICKCNYI